MKIKLLPIALINICIFICSSCSNTVETTNGKDFFEDTQPPLPTMLDDKVAQQAQKAFFSLEKSLPKVYIDSQLLYVVEGDLLMDADELYYYCQSQLALMKDEKKWHTEKMENNAFTVSTINGVPEVWPPNYVVKYAILKRSFTSPDLYDSAKIYMNKAAKDWMGACNVKFQYLPQYDETIPGSPLPDSLTFCVRQFNANGAFIAMAFFPADIPQKRRLLLDVSFFNPQLKFNKVGILRHELGHILGARHEHIWSKEYGCQGEEVFAEGRGGIPLTKYDPYSVMHYLCGKSGTRTLEITRFDTAGAQQLYGSPR